MSIDGFKSQLEGILEDYESIAKAPSRADLEQRAAASGMDIVEVLRREALEDYKAFDADTGRIYLIKNPATWPITERGVRRPAPVFQMTLTDARSGISFGIGVGKKRKGSVSDCF